MILRFLLLAAFSLSLAIAEGVPKVLVSIAPQKYLVDRIAQGKADVMVLVPPGASPHSYEPSMRQMMEACQGKLWFRTGESFEMRAIATFSPYMEIVDLRDGIPLLPLSCCCSDKNAHDSHIWLSPRLLKIQAAAINEGLKRLLPEESSFFDENFLQLEKDLEELHLTIQAELFLHPSHTILVSHPAFGYFCKEYGVEQLSIEIDGKEPTAKQITSLLMEARKKGISTVYIQPQYSKKGAERMAQELNASVEIIDPYRENVVENLRTIAYLFTHECH